MPASETKPRLHALRAKASKNKKNVNFTKVFASLTREAPAAQTACGSIGELIIINFAKNSTSFSKNLSTFFNLLLFLKRSQISWGFPTSSQIFSTNTSTTSQASPQQANNTQKKVFTILISVAIVIHASTKVHPIVIHLTLYQNITSLTAQPHHHCFLLQPNPVSEPDNISCRSFWPASRCALPNCNTYAKPILNYPQPT